MKVQDLIAKVMKSHTADIVSILEDQGLVKAAEALKDSEKITDNWQAGEKHSTIDAAEAKTGPDQAAEGSNTGRMNREYSRNAPQKGVQEDAERFLDALEELKATAKAHGAALSGVLASMKSLSGLLTIVMKKAEDDMDEEPMEKAEEEEDEVMKAAAVKTRDFIAQATAALSKANSLRKAAEEMEEDDEKEQAKALKATARAAKKSAALLLGKARVQAYMAGSVALRKAIVDLCAKADVEAMDEDEFEKAEESEKTAKATTATSTGAAAKAATDDKGNQSDSQDAANGNQAATAKALADALTGIAALKTTVTGLMDAVSGASRGAFVAKADIVALETPADIYDRIEEAMDQGLISADQSILAQRIAGQLEAVAKGRLDKSIALACIEKAPFAVKQLYANIA